MGEGLAIEFEQLLTAQRFVPVEVGVGAADQLVEITSHPLAGEVALRECQIG